MSGSGIQDGNIRLLGASCASQLRGDGDTRGTSANDNDLVVRSGRYGRGISPGDGRDGGGKAPRLDEY